MAANNAIKYISNVGRSFGYAAVESIKDMNPSIKSFKDTNNDTLKTTYAAIKNIKSTTKTAVDKAISLKYGQLANTARKNLFEDLKTGKFYNKERIDKAENAAAEAMLGGEDLVFEFEDDNDDDEHGFDFAQGNDDLMSMMDNVGEKTSTAISTVVARSAEYTVQATKEMGSALYNQNVTIYAGLHANLKTINENISMLIEFSKGPVQTHLENSRNFYEKETSLSEERNNILKEMLELQKEYYKPTKSSSKDSNNITISDVLDSENMVNIEQYFKRVMQNIKSSGSGNIDMLKMMMDTGAIDSIVASPLEEVTKMIVNQLIPKTFKSAMKSFNESISGAFSSMIANVNNMEDWGIKGLIKKVFGIDDSVKKSINVGDYEKGAVPFDGVTRKSIVEVIPTYLAQISSALTGKNETRYDYESGKFVNIKDIKKNQELKEERYASQASYDLYSYINKYMSNMEWANQKDEEQFKKDLDKILHESYKNGKLFNSRSKVSASSYGLKGGKKSDVNIELIKKMFDQMPASVKLQWANNMFSAKQSQNRDMQFAEDSGISVLTALFNDSISSNDSKKEAAPGKGNSIFSSIYNETRRIRELLESGDRIPTPTAPYPDYKTAYTNTTESGIVLSSGIWTPSGVRRVDINTDSSKINTNKKRKQPEGPTLGSNKSIEENISIFEEMMKKSSYENDSDTSATDAVENAKGPINKIKALYGSIIGKPVDLAVKILNKSENVLYDFIFGKAEGENKNKFRDEIDELGLGGAIIKRLKGTFEKFNNWLEDHILKPIGDFFDKGKLKEKMKNFFDNTGLSDIFGKAKDKVSKGTAGFRSRFKDTFKRAGSFVKDTFSEATDKLEITRKLNEKGKSVTEDNDIINDTIRFFKGGGSISNAAKGIKRVDKTGLVAVSEGEMIIPSSLNPYNISKNLKAENKAKKDFIKNFADGEEVNEDDIDNKWLDRYLDMLEKTDNDEIISKLIRKIASKSKNVKDKDRQERIIKIFKSKYKELDSSHYEEGRDKNLVGKSLDELQNAIKGVVDYIKGLAPEDKNDENKQKESMVNTAFGELKKYAPEVSAGAVIGAGVSFIPGIIGGPILGAAVGAGVSLIKHSDKVRDMLFGKQGKDGEYEKGLLPENLSKNIKKYVPTMAKGATLGAITSILPFVPGGPVAGIILGSAAGFAIKNEKVHEKLFGEEGLLGPKFADRVKKTLPKMGAGALAGLIAGPFGIGTNLLLGSAIGFATSTNTFKDAFFGKEDDNGDRQGGVFQLMVDNLFKPVKEFGIETKDKLSDWVDKYIKQPLKDAADPIKKQFQLMFSSITGFFKNAIDRVMNDNIGTPFEKFLRDRVFKPVSSIVKGFVTGALMPVKGILSMPGRVVSGVGNTLRTKQVREGNATYMTAAERLLYRHSRGRGITGRRFNKGDGKAFKQYDEQMYNMDADQILNARDSLQGILDADKQMTSPTNFDEYKDFDADIRKNKNLTYGQTNKIIKQVKKVIKETKDPEAASDKINKIIANLELPEEEKNKIAKSANKFLAALKDQNSRKGQIANKKTEILSNLGIDVQDEKHIPKIIELLNAEYKAKNKALVEEEKNKTPEEKFNDWESIRHDETINKLDQIRDAIVALTFPDSDARDEFLDSSMKKYEAKNQEISERKSRLSEIRKQAKDEKEKIDKKKEEKKQAKRSKNKGLFLKLFGNEDIDWRNPDDYDAITGARKLNSEADAKNVSTDGVSLSQNGGDTNNKKSKPSDKSAFYTFVDGKPLRYIEDNVGKLTIDKSDSDTRKTRIYVEKEDEQKRGFLESFAGLSLFDNIKKKLKKSPKDEEDEEVEKKSGILSRIFGLIGKSTSKLGTVAKIAGLTVGLPVLVGVWKDTIWPKLQPIIEPLADNIKSAVSGIWENFQDWLAGDVPGKDGRSGGLPGVLEKLAKYWADGFETILTKVIPKAAEIFISVLPTALLNLGKGIVKGLGMSIDNIINAGRPSTDADKLMEDYIPAGNTSIASIDSKNSSSDNPIISGLDLSAWNLDNSAMSGLISKATGYNGSEVSTTDINGNTLVTGKSTATGIPGETISQLKDVQYGTHKYTIDNSIQYTLPDGTKITGEELFNTDQVIGYSVDNDGTYIPITGKDLYRYPEIAEQLGISHTTSTESERQATADSMGLSDDHTAGEEILKVGTKSFLRGSTRGGKALTKIGKFGQKIPIIKAAAYPLTAIGKGIEGVGNLGNKILPGFMTGNYKTTAGKAASKTTKNATERVAAEVVDNTAYNAAKQAASGAQDDIIDVAFKEADDVVEIVDDATYNAAMNKTMLSTGADQVIDTTAKEITEDAIGGAAKQANKESREGIISRIITWITTKVNNFFTEGTLSTYIRKASEEMGKLAAKETAEQAAEELAEKVAQKLTKYIGEKLAKAAGKTVAKAASAVATAGVTTVAFGVAAFISGWNNANNIIGVVNDIEEASGLTKLVCGIVSALNEVFCLGLVPISMLFDIILPLVQKIPVFSEAATDLIEDREESANVVAKFNEENNTNLTVEEYNKARERSEKGNFVTNSTAWQSLFGRKASIDDEGNYVESKEGIAQKGLSKAKNFFLGNKETGEGNIIDKAKDGLSGASNWITEKDQQAKKWIENKTSDVNTWFGDKVEDVKEFTNTVGDYISNFGSTVTSTVKHSWDWAIGTKQLSASTFIGNKIKKDDNPLSTFSYVLARVSDSVLTPLHGIISFGKTVAEELEPFMRLAKNIGNAVIDDAKSGISMAFEGCTIGEYFDCKTTDGGENELSKASQIIKYITRTVLFLPATLAWAGGRIRDGFKSVIEGGKQVIANIKNSETELITNAMNGQTSIHALFSISNEDDGEGPVKWVSTAVRHVVRMFTIPAAAVAYAGNKISTGVKAVVDGARTVFDNIVTSETELFNEAREGNVGFKKVLTISNENDGKGPVKGISTAVRCVLRALVTGPISLVYSLGVNVGKSLKKITDGGSTAMSKITEERERLNKYLEQDTDNLDGYWKNKTDTGDGIFGLVAESINKITRILLFIPAALRVALNKVGNVFDSVKDWVSEKWKKLKEKVNGISDDIEKDHGGGGSGSGLIPKINLKSYSGRGSGASYSDTQKQIKDGTFISQVNNKASKKKFNRAGDTSKQTLYDSGCGPAAAAMVINSFNDSSDDKMTMDQASKPALKYKVKNGGVTADYFGYMFKKKGLTTKYIMGSDVNTRASEIATSLYNNNKVVLMGKDQSNKSKENSPFGPNSHYVVATGMSSDGKYIYINDPESTKPNIAYPAERILKTAKMGITASAYNKYAGKGSGLLNKIIRKYSGRGSIPASQYMDENLGSWSPVTVEEMAAWINSVAGASSPWRNNTEAAQIFVKAGNESGLDPRYILAHAAIETGWGTSQICRDKNNYFGIGAFDATPYSSAYSFGSGMEAGVVGGAMWIRENYYDAGQRSVRAMVSDPNGHNYATAGISGWATPISQIMASGPENTKLVTDNNSYTSTGADAGSISSSSNSGSDLISKILGVWDDLAAGYGISSGSSDSSSSDASWNGVVGGTEQQKALVAKMKSVEGQLAYSQSARNPDNGSGDCSSTVQWAYQKVLGVDPGSWTGAQETDSDLYTVTEGYNTCISDPSKLQPGDLVLYRKSDGRSWHVEMYAGNNQLIGHGGGADGTKKGPTVKPLNTTFSSIPYMVRRWTGFMHATNDDTSSTSNTTTDTSVEAGSGSGLSFDSFNSSGGLTKTGLNKIQSSMWINNNQDKILYKDMSKYREDEIDKIAATYSARGTAPGKTTVMRPEATQVSVTPTVTKHQSSGGINSKDATSALLNMVTLLTKIVDNTSILQSMVAVLSEILTIMNQEAALSKTSANSKQAESLKTKKEALFSKLGSLSGDNETVKQLVKNAERLARG